MLYVKSNLPFFPRDFMENHLYIFLNISAEKTNNFLLLLKCHFQLVEKKRNQLKEIFCF